MTLEEIERESAKLSAEERSKLAAKLLVGLEVPDSGEVADEPGPCVCPSCKKLTKRIDIEVESTEWGRVQFLGILSSLYPDKQRCQVCEHCGNVFNRVLATNPVADRVITFLFYAIPAAGIVCLIWKFVQRMTD